MEEIEFYYKNRRYTCNTSQDNSSGILLIKKPESSILELRIAGEKLTGYKRTETGNIEQLD